MKKWLAALALALVMALTACGGGGEDEPADDSAMEEPADEGTDEGSNADGGTVDAEAAEQAFQQNCASCHGGDLGGGVGPALTEVGSKYSAEEIVNIIKNGKGQMPAQNVDDETAQLIASWLATMK